MWQPDGNVRFDLLPKAKSKLQAKLSEMQSDLAKAVCVYTALAHYTGSLTAKASGNKAQLDELRRELDLRSSNALSWSHLQLLQPVAED